MSHEITVTKRNFTGLKPLLLEVPAEISVIFIYHVVSSFVETNRTNEGKKTARYGEPKP